MTSRNAILLAACALTLGGLGNLGNAHAQGSEAPFTIRRPPDGATVRENVQIEIPRASIPKDGFVAFTIDKNFTIAVTPKEESGNEKNFTYLWDTKGLGIKDGEHTLRAELYVPASGNEVAMSQKGASEVRIIVENKIHKDPGLIHLRYKFREGADLAYARYFHSFIVGGVSETGTTTSDQDIATAQGKLQVDVFDVRHDPMVKPDPTVNLLRNRLTSLEFTSGGQETIFDPSQLPGSLYQELNPLGQVLYQTGGSVVSGDLGGGQALFLYASLDPPLLPSGPVTLGQKWLTYKQSIDIPGVLQQQQPKVTLTNTLVDLEWDGGYPTARIHQALTSDSLTPAGIRSIDVNGIEITSPSIKFERDIYLAYKSGTLVRTTRSLTISGRTTSMVGMPPEQVASNTPANNQFNPPQAPAGPPSQGFNRPRMAGGGPAGVGPEGGKFGRGNPGSMGPMGPPQGFNPGFNPGNSNRRGMQGMPGNPFGRPGGPGGVGGTGFNPPPMGGNTQPQGQDHAITLKSTLTTELASSH